MHLGDRTHHPREDFQRQEGQETVDSWSEKGKNPYVEFCRQERPKVKQPLRHFPTSVTPSSLNLDKMFPSKESQSIPSSSNNNGLSHPKRRQKSSEGDWFVDSQGIDPEVNLSWAMTRIPARWPGRGSHQQPPPLSHHIPHYPGTDATSPPPRTSHPPSPSSTFGSVNSSYTPRHSTWGNKVRDITNILTFKKYSFIKERDLIYLSKTPWQDI